MRRIAQVVFVSVASLCSGCFVPLTQRYYVPAAQGATVANTNCAGYPPYAAHFNFGETVGDVFLDKSVLTIVLRARPGVIIAFDPTLIRLEAEGQSVVPTSVHFITGQSSRATVSDAKGPIEVQTGHLTVVLSLEIGHSLNVVTHLPSISVNGTNYNFSEVSFTFKKQTHMVPLILNC